MKPPKKESEVDKGKAPSKESPTTERKAPSAPEPDGVYSPIFARLLSSHALSVDQTAEPKAPSKDAPFIDEPKAPSKEGPFVDHETKAPSKDSDLVDSAAEPKAPSIDAASGTGATEAAEATMVTGVREVKAPSKDYPEAKGEVGLSVKSTPRRAPRAVFGELAASIDQLAGLDGDDFSDQVSRLAG